MNFLIPKAHRKLWSLETAQKEGFGRAWLKQVIVEKEKNVSCLYSIELEKKPDANLPYRHLRFPDYMHIFYNLLMMLTFQFSSGKTFPIFEKD